MTDHTKPARECATHSSRLQEMREEFREQEAHQVRVGQVGQVGQDQIIPAQEVPQAHQVHHRKAVQELAQIAKEIGKIQEREEEAQKIWFEGGEAEAQKELQHAIKLNQYSVLRSNSTSFKNKLNFD
jgi:glycine/D-amino acid oxidase-like deaminating enzyme